MGPGNTLVIVEQTPRVIFSLTGRLGGEDLDKVIQRAGTFLEPLSKEERYRLPL